jgi:ubiquitin C-terminal hydrolase
VYDALSRVDEHFKGRQEDAEEFLGFILDGLHEELLSLARKSAPDPVAGRGKGEEQRPAASSNTNDWVEVGRAGKTVGTLRHADTSHSPITHIFGGLMRSVLRAGARSSTTLEPFHTLQLHISVGGPCPLAAGWLLIGC